MVMPLVSGDPGDPKFIDIYIYIYKWIYSIYIIHQISVLIRA